MVQIRKLISQGSIVKLRRGTEGSRSGLASYSPESDARIHLVLPDSGGLILSCSLTAEPLSVPLACNAGVPAGSLPPLPNSKGNRREGGQERALVLSPCFLVLGSFSMTGDE